MSTVPRIVLTGGPCAGKTSALSHLAAALRAKGYTPLTIKESATTLIQKGISACSVGNDAFQRAVLHMQLRAEDAALARAQFLAARGKRPVILKDRGICDGAGYMERAAFEELCMGEIGPFALLRDERYDAVLHLRSAAHGAEAHYTLANNAARTETLEQARALDEHTLRAWVGHPHVVVCENRPGRTFADKLAYAEKAVWRVLGVPQSLEIERKFLVRPQTHAIPGEVPHRTVRIE